MFAVWLAVGVAPSWAVTLDEALSAAETHAVEVGLVRENTHATETLTGQALSQLTPKLVAAGDYNVNQYEIALDSSAMIPPEFADLIEPTDPIVIQKKQFLTWNATVVQPLLNGQAFPAYLAAKKVVAAARADEQGQLQQIRAGVAKSFYGLLTARKAVSLAEKAEVLAQAQLEVARRSVAAGTEPPRTNLQAELRVSQSHRDVLTARQQLRNAEIAFGRMTGLAADAPLDEPPPIAVPASLNEALAASGTRPDIAAADLRVGAVRHTRMAHDLGWAPSFSGRFTYNWTENTGFAGKKGIWVAALHADWVLWDGGYRIAKSAEYQAQAHAAGLYAEKVRLDATSQVEGAWEALRRADAAVVATEQESKLAKENFRLANDGLAAGTATWLEVSMAELGVQSAELNALIERMNRDFSAIDLRVAMGEWRSASQSPPAAR